MSLSWGTPTDGIGSTTSAHLNLTRTMADVWGLESPGTRLRTPDGRYLHRDCMRLTLVRADAWHGPGTEAASLIERLKHGLRASL